MTMNREPVRLSVSLSAELNDRLDQLARSSGATKTDILRRALALYDVAAEAKQQKNKIGILDQDRKVVSEIVGI
ncbi:ribbon-helix-helix domain-containing protein [Burkholderia glumae]|uniref:ribbon-helix-helix domain-containing protein n=1 Tax=Burkholderia glumae TaxID=337 RepID=UPI002036AABE|nr:ribbon-helix-helix domain-containing protein [Burkholderia glumae]MCM2496041.1 ribbon-helix-helix domain-containing protein [Burkholderia glumae]